MLPNVSIRFLSLCTRCYLLTGAVFTIHRPSSILWGVVCRDGLIPDIALGSVEILHASTNVKNDILGRVHTP